MKCRIVSANKQYISIENTAWMQMFPMGCQFGLQCRFIRIQVRCLKGARGALVNYKYVHGFKRWCRLKPLRVTSLSIKADHHSNDIFIMMIIIIIPSLSVRRHPGCLGDHHEIIIMMIMMMIIIIFTRCLSVRWHPGWLGSCSLQQLQRYFLHDSETVAGG